MQFNQIGDKDPQNKNRVEAMVDALFRTDGGVRRSWITKEDINNPKNVSTYAHLLDGILNSDTVTLNQVISKEVIFRPTPLNNIDRTTFRRPEALKP